MSQFRYTGRDARGQKVSGVLEASSAQAAAGELQAQQVTVNRRRGCFFGRLHDLLDQALCFAYGQIFLNDTLGDRNLLCAGQWQQRTGVPHVELAAHQQVLDGGV